MKAFTAITATTLLVFASVCGRAAAFDSGSTGADGALNVTNDMVLQLPPDGVFNYTTITVAPGVTLRFQRNEFNTPVYLLATGDVTIAGIINVNGQPGFGTGAGEGGPGGFDGGSQPIDGEPPGDGYGPGGGRADSEPIQLAGAYGNTTATSSTNRYGNGLLQPLVGGSGGAGQHRPVFGQPWGGAGGGGAILIASTTRIYVQHQILAQGGDTQIGFGGGSGGAIRLVAPTVAAPASASLSARAFAGGGSGRIRVDTLNRTEFNPMVDARLSVGRNMTVFSTPMLKLDFLEVAGKPIPPNAADVVVLTLDLNSPTNQVVTLRATGFVGPANLEVAITPENGPSRRFLKPFTAADANPITNTVEVIIPAGVPCRVQAWTR